MEDKLRNLIFLLISIIIVILSIIVIFISPIISGSLSNGRKLWKSINCKKYSDECDDERIKIRNEKLIDINTIKGRLESCLKGRNLCQRKKAMYGLEYASIISDLFFGIVISLLFILNYKKENYGKYIGLMVIIIGIISSILTLLYVIYSSYIFNKDYAYAEGDNNNNDCVPRLKENGAFGFWDKYSDKFFCYFYDQDNADNIDNINFFIKYKELGKKQYNYNEEFDLQYNDINSEIHYCTFIDMKSLLGTCYLFHNRTPSKTYYGDGTKYCENFYFYPQTGKSNKKLYDKWLTTIIFSCFIIVAYIGIIGIGFILFLDKNNEYNNYQILVR